MYEQLLVSVKEILNTPKVSKEQQLQEICSLLKEKIEHYDWVGFYFHIPGEEMLELRAFAGLPTDHTKIPFGKGICGQVAVSNQNFIVPDVSLQDNYISCNMHVKSEIVIPLFKNGENIGQIDIDSNTKNAFTEDDAQFLSAVNKLVADSL